ncbi:MAG: hypothetical protein QOG03_1833 [Actinomycetota bacterium]|jgi:hypothetical protein|nr:hypothetical protein [Actinomycetota bacterium]
MQERCPRCHYKFEREEGFFLGAFVINFAVTEGLIGLVLGAFILTENANPNPPIGPVISFGLIAAVIAPILFYPFSKTIWLAIDLIAHPTELDTEPET